MSWGAVVAVGGSLISGALSSKAGKKGADAQAQANAEANALMREFYDRTENNLMPYMDAGGWAIDRQRQFLDGDYSAALNSPDYKAALEEGFKGLDYGATARGNLWGGGMDADRMRLGQNLASLQIGNYYNRLAGLSGQGQQAASSLGQFGANYAQNAGANMQATGAARASSYANSANAWNNVIGTAVGAFGQRQGGGG